MQHLYTPENLEKIEQYLKGTLTEEERQLLENQIEQDDDFRQLVEQHRLLLEGMKVNQYREDKQRLKSIHEEMLVEEEDIVLEETKNPSLNLRRIISTAAMIALGILAGIGLMKIQDAPGSNPIVDVNVTQTGNYGGVPSGLPLYDINIPLKKMSLDENSNLILKEQTSIPLLVFGFDKKGLQYHFENGGLYIITDKFDSVEDVNSIAVELVLQEWEDSNLRVALLKIDNKFYQIPLSDEEFSIIQGN